MLCCARNSTEVIGRFERKGYKLVGIKVLVPTPVSGACGGSRELLLVTDSVPKCAPGAHTSFGSCMIW